MSPAGADLTTSADRPSLEKKHCQPGAAVAVENVNLWTFTAFAAENRLPAEAGGLMAYGASLPDLFRRATATWTKVLRAQSPPIFPSNSRPSLSSSSNLRTAKSLGIEMPPTLLARADEVIE